MKTISALLLATSLAVPACSNDVTQRGDDGPGTGSGSGSGSGDEWDQVLASRVTDYSSALRIAALRLTGDLPTMAEINQVASATDDARRATYEGLVHDYLD